MKKHFSSFNSHNQDWKKVFTNKQFIHDVLKFDLHCYKFKNDKFRSVVQDVWDLFEITVSSVPLKGEIRKKYRDCVRHT